MLATEKGFFMDARLGPVIQEELDKLKANVGEINSNLPEYAVAYGTTPDNVNTQIHYSMPHGWSAINTVILKVQCQNTTNYSWYENVLTSVYGGRLSFSYEFMQANNIDGYLNAPFRVYMMNFSKFIDQGSP